MRSTRPLVLTLFLAGAARAQSPAERTLVERWDDSVSHIATPAALDRFASPDPKSSTGANDLRIAMVQLRRAALMNDRQLTELALIRLDAVAHSHHDWAWPEFLMARAFYALSDSGVPLKMSSGVNEGEQYIDAAMRHLAAALKIDPGMARSRKFALGVLVPEGDRELRDPEVAMLRTLLTRRDPESDALLVEGRRLRTALKYDSALTYLDRAIAAGGETSRLQLERARTLQALGDSAGAGRAYWRGVEQMTPTGRESYRHDLAWILAPDTLAQFDKVPADSVGPWLHDFWTRRDAEAANVFGERLIEHFRRWNFAFAHFRVDRPWRLNEFKRIEYYFEAFDPCIPSDSELYDLLAREQPAYPGDSRRREPLLDNRGLIYLHHGAPYRVVYLPGTTHEPPGFALTDPPPPSVQGNRPDKSMPFVIGSPGGTATFAGSTPILPQPQRYCLPKKGVVVSADGPNESWLYWFDGAWRVMNFRGSCALGLLAPTTLTSYLPIGRSGRGILSWAARADLTPAYAAAADQMLYPPPSKQGASCWDRITPVIRISRADADVATRTDSHTPFVPRPWNAVIQAFGLGAGADHSGEALVTFAIPIDSLRVTGSGSGATYDVAARIVGYDHKSGQTFSVDTVRRIPAPRTATGAKAHLSGFFEFALDPGDWQIAVRLRQPGDSLGAYSLLTHVVIDAAAPLLISDIVTGASNGSSWPAPDGSPFPVAVLGAWPAGGTAEVYYEVRGMRAGDEYRTVVTVKDESGRATDAIRIETTDHATGPTTAVRKAIGLSQLKPGTYRVTVTVTRAGVSAVRTRDLMIAKP